MITKYKYIGIESRPTRLVQKGCIHVVRIQDIFGQCMNISFEELTEAQKFINLFVYKYTEINILGGILDDL